MKSPEQLVIDDQDQGLFSVHRSAFTAPEIFQLEQDRIFNTSWLYVGHESEVPNPSDFRTRRVGGRSIIYARDRNGEIRVMLNTCRHRGAEVCREERGNRKVFTCFYHGWAYDDSGTLIGVPGEDAYSRGFQKGQHGLSRPRCETYRGFTFVTFSPDAPGLHTYLADARYLFDLVADQSADGMQIVSGTHYYSMNANWKLLMENSCDGYHAFSVHQTYFEMMLSLGVTPGLAAEQGKGRATALGNGHAVIESPELGMPITSGEVLGAISQRRADFAARLGEAHAKRMLNTSRNLIVFPNLAVIDINFGIQVRTMFPTAPDRTEIVGWQLMPLGIPEGLKSYRLDNAMSFWGPAGLATPDDVEGLEACQRGFSSAREVQWSDVSRGMHAAEPNVLDELQMRAFWRQWNTLLTGRPARCEGPHYDVSYLRGRQHSTSGGLR
jgi:p-cumate 2,3-dioxygenase subunit alpha